MSITLTPNSRPSKRQKLIETPATVASDYSDGESCIEEEAHDDCIPLKLLPDDMIGSIFFGGYFDSLEVVQINSVASKRMTNIARAQVTMLDLRKTSIKTEDIASIVARFPNLTDLDLSYCDKLKSVPDLKQLKLRFLSLRGTAVTDAGIQDFIKNKNSSLLEELDLSASKPGQSEFITDRTAKLLSKYCPNLKLLKLGWRRGITNAALPSMAKLKHLAVLDLSITAVTARGCSTLSQFTSLVKLDLSACSIGEAGLSKLVSPGKMSELTHLELRHNRNLNEESLKLLVTQAPKLELLNVENSGLTRSSHKIIFLALQRRGVRLRVEWDHEGVVDDR